MTALHFVAPQLATLVDAAPPGDAWLHEIKFDGYRLQCLVNGARVRLLSRSGQDWTARFPELAARLGARRWKGVILDGEVVVLDARGRSEFQQLQARLAEGAARGVTYFAFDLLHQGDQSLLSRPLVERKAALRRLLPRTGRGPVRYSEHVDGAGPRTHAASCRRGLEGIISKRRDAAYASGRSRDWLKVKCVRQQELIVVGYTQPQGSRTRIGALLVAVRDEAGRLRYAGKVGSGFSVPLLRQLHERLGPLTRATPPLAPSPTTSAGTVWVEPRLVVEVRFTEWTSEGLLRHPTFLGVREDKMAREVKRETAAAAGSEGLTHPDKVLYPEQGITKRDLAAYYDRVAPLMLPHVAGRPLSLVRCPDGRRRSCFFQKHLGSNYPEALHSVAIRQSDGIRPYAVVEDAAGLRALVQMGVLEIHVWGARADRVEAPDRMVFDLDPGVGVDWAMICEAAETLRGMLEELALQSWVKTSGGKGVHVVVPIERRATWAEVSAFARGIAETLAAHQPERYVSRASRAERPGRIFVDWLRNTRGATAVGAWSTRAREGAPVSRPCTWSELAGLGAADTLTVGAVLADGPPARTDPWQEMTAVRQRLRSARR